MIPIATKATNEKGVLRQVSSLLHKVSQRLWTVYYLKPVVFPLRARRLFREKLITKGWKKIRNHPDFTTQSGALAERLQSPSFQHASETLQTIMDSSYEFRLNSEELLFKFNNDIVRVHDIAEIPWNIKGGIPAEDINRSNFISFIDQAVLVKHGEEEQHLNYLTNSISQLERYASITGPFLAIPWQALPIARRLVNLLCGISLVLKARPDLAQSTSTTMIVSHVGRLSHLLDDIREDDLKYNHQTTEMFAQCIAAWIIDDGQKLTRVSGQLVEALKEQVGSDGYHLERSATYQAHLIGHLDVLIAGGILPGEAMQKVSDIRASMRKALAIMCFPDGQISLFNDCGIGDGPTPASLGVVEDIPTDDGVYRLPDSGFIRVNSGPSCVIFDAGECGAPDQPGHAHADFLSFQMTVFGERFIVDPGTATYKAGEKRTWTRSAANHNGPAIDGFEPCDFYGAFRVGRRGRAYEQPVTAEFGSHYQIGGYQTGFDRVGGRVSRELYFVEHGNLCVNDRLFGVQTKMQLRSRFFIDSSWEVVRFEGSEITFVHRDYLHKVRMTIVSGTAEVRSTSEYYPFGPRNPKMASVVDLSPIDQDSSQKYQHISIKLENWIGKLENSR